VKQVIKFGTGGWRAIIGDGFTFSNVRRVAQAAALYLQENKQDHKPVVIGHDLRFLSGRFSRAIAEILVHNGIPVWFIEPVVPTPMLMYAVEQEKLAMGLMVTASHNPSRIQRHQSDRGRGQRCPGGGDQPPGGALPAHPSPWRHPPSPSSTPWTRGKSCSTPTRTPTSIPSLAQIDVPAVQQLNLNVLFNPMFGVAKDIMAMCLASLRCSVDLINAERDTMFGQRAPSPSREALQDMEYLMKQGHYHIGIATDGDSDRIGLYDEKGNYITANEILKLLYYYLKQYRKERGGVVRNITTTPRIGPHCPLLRRTGL